MRGQGCAVGGWPAARQTHAFRDIEDYAGEAIFIEVDFLVVGDFANGAGYVSVGYQRGEVKALYLTSAKVEGRSTIRAPPKSGVLRNVVILRDRALGISSVQQQCW